MIERNSGHLQLDCGKNYKDFDENKWTHFIDSDLNFLFTDVEKE